MIYTSHTLEHLTQGAVDFTLSEIYRILKKGGGLRVSVPNIDLLLERYEKTDKEWFQIHFPAIRWELDHPKRKGDYRLEYVLIGYFASSLVDDVSAEEVQNDFSSMNRVSFLDHYKEKAGGYDHKNWFNFDKLNKLLKESGFSRILRSQHRQSIFTEFCHRGIDERVPELSIYMDAMK